MFRRLELWHQNLVFTLKSLPSVRGWRVIGYQGNQFCPTTIRGVLHAPSGPGNCPRDLLKHPGLFRVISGSFPGPNTTLIRMKLFLVKKFFWKLFLVSEIFLNFFFDAIVDVHHSVCKPLTKRKKNFLKKPLKSHFVKDPSDFIRFFCSLLIVHWITYT